MDLSQERKAEKFDEIHALVKKAMKDDLSLDWLGASVIKETARL